MSRAKKPPVPVEEEAQRRRAEDALERDDPDDPRRRVRPAHADDPLAEELARDAVEDLTTGGHAAGERDDEVSEDEIGGPFVETDAADEIAVDDESEPERVEPAPSPRTRGGR